MHPIHHILNLLILIPLVGMLVAIASGAAAYGFAASLALYALYPNY